MVGAFLVLVLLAFGCGRQTESSLHAVYGDDDRVEYGALSKPELKELTRASVALIDERYLKESLAGDFRFSDEVKSYQSYYGLCKDVRFAEQPNPADCSGFLIDQTKVMTAGHCVKNMSECGRYRFVLDFFYAGQADTGAWTIAQSQVYKCRQILMTKNNPDFAVIELDRPVLDRAPLQMRLDASVVASEKIMMMGNPHGLPMKFVTSGEVQPNNQFADPKHYFEAEIDHYSGNSGSAVLSQETHDVVGIMSVGFGEFEDSTNQDGSSCRRPRRFDSSHDVGAYPFITRVDVIADMFAGEL